MNSISHYKSLLVPSFLLMLAQFAMAANTITSIAPVKDKCALLQAQQVNKQSNLRAALLVWTCQGQSVEPK